MKVAIKDLAVKTLTIGSKGVEFDVSDKEGDVGDLFVTMSKVVWCKGKTSKKKGVPLTWQQIMDIAEHKDEVLKSVKKLKK